MEEIQSLNNLNHEDALSLFQINTCSLPKNIEKLEYLFDKSSKFEWTFHNIRIEKIISVRILPKKIFWRFQL